MRSCHRRRHLDLVSNLAGVLRVGARHGSLLTAKRCLVIGQARRLTDDARTAVARHSLDSVEKILDEFNTGTVLGTHNGVIDFTIGQRRGLGIGGRKDADESEGPLYVVGIDAAAHRVIVGPQSALACHRVGLSEASWVSPDGGPAAGTAVLARLRNTAPALPAIIASIDGDRVAVMLDAPQSGISTGQAAVLYDASNTERVLGGGWITEAPTAGLEAIAERH